MFFATRNRFSNPPDKQGIWQSWSGNPNFHNKRPPSFTSRNRKLKTAIPWLFTTSNRSVQFSNPSDKQGIWQPWSGNPNFRNKRDISCISVVEVKWWSWSSFRTIVFQSHLLGKMDSFLLLAKQQEEINFAKQMCEQSCSKSDAIVNDPSIA